MAQLQIDLVVDDKGKLVLTGFGKEVDRVMFSSKAAVMDFGRQLAIGGAALTAFAAAGGLVVSRFTGIADTYTLIEGRLKLVTSSTEQLDRVQEALYQTSLRTHQGFETTAALYTGLARSTTELHISEDRLLNITEMLNKSMVVSGATQEAAANSMQQLNQAMFGGVVRAEEFNSIMDNTPRVLQAVADGLGKSMGQLRTMMLEGKLTAEQFIEGFEKGAAKIQQEFASLPVTTGQAMTDLNTVWKSIIDGANDSSGATGKISTSIIQLTSTIEDNKDSIVSVFSSMISGAELVVKGVDKIVEMWTYLYNISDAQAKGMGFAQIMGMSPEELQKTLLDGSFELSVALQQIKDEITQISKVREFESDNAGWTEAAEARYQGLIKQRDTLQSQLDLLRQIKEVAPDVGTDDQSPDTAGTVYPSAQNNSDAAETISGYWVDAYAGIAEAAAQNAIKEQNTLNQRADLHGQLTDEIKQLTLDEVDYKKWALSQQIEDMRLTAGVDKALQDEISEYHKLKLQEITDAHQAATDTISQAWEDFGQDARSAFDDTFADFLRNDFDDLGDAWDSFCDSMESKWADTAANLVSTWIDEGLADYFSDSDSGDSSWISSAWDAVTDWFSYADGGRVPVKGYAPGGLIYGGRGIDDIYAGALADGTRVMVTGGEYIMPVDKTAENYGLLEDIRAGKVRGYATGGINSEGYTDNSWGAAAAAGWNNLDLRDLVLGFDNKFQLSDIAKFASWQATLVSWVVDATRALFDNKEKLDVRNMLDRMEQGLIDVANTISLTSEPLATSDDITGLSDSFNKAIDESINAALEAQAQAIAAMTADDVMAYSTPGQDSYQASSYALPGSSDSNEHYFGIGSQWAATMGLGQHSEAYSGSIGSIDYGGGGADGMGGATGGIGSGQGQDHDPAGAGYSGGAAAAGGVITSLDIPEEWGPPADGDDGYGALKLGEGVIDADTMQILSKKIRNGDLDDGDSSSQSDLQGLRSLLMSALALNGERLAQVEKIVRKWDTIGMPPERGAV